MHMHYVSSEVRTKSFTRLPATAVLKLTKPMSSHGWPDWNSLPDLNRQLTFDFKQLDVFGMLPSRRMSKNEIPAGALCDSINPPPPGQGALRIQSDVTDRNMPSETRWSL
jgi:hypothetical protein